VPAATQEIRRVVNETGYGTRISDRDLETIAQSDNPQRACEDLVRRFGGNPGSYRNAIDRVVQIVQQNGSTPQDAPQDDGDTSVTEYADRLRTIAARLGLPASQVESVLTEAGMVAPIADLDEEDEGDEQQEGGQNVDRQILKALKKVNKRLDQIKDRL
jgi:hypothetical protein